PLLPSTTLFRSAVRVVHVAAGVAAGHHTGAELLGLLDGVDGHVARAGHDDGLAREALAAGFQHFFHEVDQAVPRRFLAHQAAAVIDPFAGEDAGFIAAADAPVLAEHVADLPRAHADVAGRHVDVGADVPVQLRHEALAEAHHFTVGFALRVEVGTALAAPDGQAGQGVFENLLEAEEFDDAQVHGRMESQSALVRADGAVELDAEAAVDPHVALVVHPGDAEHDDPFRLHQPLQKDRKSTRLNS